MLQKFMCCYILYVRNFVDTVEIIVICGRTILEVQAIDVIRIVCIVVITIDTNFNIIIVIIVIIVIILSSFLLLLVSHDL